MDDGSPWVALVALAPAGDARRAPLGSIRARKLSRWDSQEGRSRGLSPTASLHKAEVVKRGNLPP